MKSALLLVNIQNDFFEGGKCPLPEASKALDNIKIVLNRFRERRLPVIFTQFINDREGAPSHWADTWGCEIHTDIAPIAGENIVKTQHWDAFKESELLKTIKDNGIKNLIICGMSINDGIDFTIRSAKEVYDIRFITLLYDACAARSLEFRGEFFSAQTVHSLLTANMNRYTSIARVSDLVYSAESVYPKQ